MVRNRRFVPGVSEGIALESRVALNGDLGIPGSETTVSEHMTWILEEKKLETTPNPGSEVQESTQTVTPPGEWEQATTVGGGW